MKRKELCPFYQHYVFWGGVYGVPWWLVAAQDKIESNFNPNAIGAKGEKGLGQFLDTTWETWGEGDPFDVNANIKAHCRYLGWLKGVLLRRDKTDWAWAIAAYNCGIGRALQANRWEDLPISTINYTQKVIEQALDYLIADLPIKKGR